MSLWILMLLVAGLVCFLLAAFKVAAGRIELVALGLALWILTSILARSAV